MARKAIKSGAERGHYWVELTIDNKRIGLKGFDYMPTSHGQGFEQAQREARQVRDRWIRDWEAGRVDHDAK